MFVFDPVISHWHNLTVETTYPCARAAHTISILYSANSSDTFNSSSSSSTNTSAPIYFYVVLFGGRNQSNVGMGDTWVFSSQNSTWFLISFATGQSPSPRWGHAQTRYNSSVSLVYGGLVGSGGNTSDSSLNVVPAGEDLWALVLQTSSSSSSSWSVTWINISPISNIPQRSFSIFVFNNINNTLFIAGGYSPQAGNAYNSTHIGVLSSDLSTVSWVTLPEPGPAVAGAAYTLLANSQNAPPQVFVFKGLLQFDSIFTVGD